MNDAIKNMLTRRSCKDFKPDMPPGEIIDQIIEAGLYAPSGMNRQESIIIAVTDKATRDKLSKLNSKYDFAHRPDPFYNAPVVLAVLASKNVPTAVYDGSLVMENLMLAAHSLGVGSCWIHRAKEVFEDPEGREILEKLGISADEYVGVGNCVIGWPDKEIETDKPRKDGRVYHI